MNIEILIKTGVVLLIAILIIYKVVSVVYRDYKKNKNLCGTDCGSCRSHCKPKKLSK